jgi:hypothetical protein
MEKADPETGHPLKYEKKLEPKLSGSASVIAC